MSSFRLKLLSAAAVVALAACSSEPLPSMAGKYTIPPNLSPTVVPFALEGDHILLEMEVQGPAENRKLLGVLNMGQAPLVLMEHVWKETGHIPHTPLDFHIGGIQVEVAPGVSGRIDDAAYPDRQAGFWFFTRNVEAGLQAGFLQNFDII